MIALILLVIIILILCAVIAVATWGATTAATGAFLAAGMAFDQMTILVLAVALVIITVLAGIGIGKAYNAGREAERIESCASNWAGDVQRRTDVACIQPPQAPASKEPTPLTFVEAPRQLPAARRVRRLSRSRRAAVATVRRWFQ